MFEVLKSGIVSYKIKCVILYSITSNFVKQGRKKMKICNNCHTSVDDGVKFCPKCGMSNFYGNELGETTILEPNQQPQFQSTQYSPTPTPTDNRPPYGAPVQRPVVPNSQAPYQPTMPVVSEKRKLKWYQILLIVVGALLVLLFAVGIVIWSQESSYEPNNNHYNDYYDDSTTTAPYVAYTKGSVVDGYYINEWANIKFPISEKFPEADSSAYSKYTDTYNDVGFYSDDSFTGRMLLIQFTDLSSNPTSYNAEKFLNELLSGIKEQYPSWTISEYFHKTIAEQDYLVCNITADGSSGKEMIFVRFEGKRVISIMVSSSTASETDDMIASVTTAN